MITQCEDSCLQAQGRSLRTQPALPFPQSWTSGPQSCEPSILERRPLVCAIDTWR